MTTTSGRLDRPRAGHTAAMDDAVLNYIAGIEPGHRPLFDRVHDLVLATHPDVVISISYRIPSYKAAGRRRRHCFLCHGIEQPHGAGLRLGP